MANMTDFSENVVKEIEARGVEPKARWHFLVRRSVFWSLAIASVLLGAISFSVGDFVFFDNEGMRASVLLETPLEGVLQSIPFLWLFVFCLFTVSAYVGLRHTRTGYRYRTLMAVAGVIVVSIALGYILNLFDFGQAVHDYLLHNTSFYDALIHSSDDLTP
jgi:glucan phosphoethanolaminetransferase (alkaline phosphatase superfamily)